VLAAHVQAEAVTEYLTWVIMRHLVTKERIVNAEAQHSRVADDTSRLLHLALLRSLDQVWQEYLAVRACLAACSLT
jgi:hypothetical protein